MTDVTPRVGVSACLLGEKTRHDGGDKRDAFVVDELGPDVTFVPVCPEVEIGLSVPRPQVQLLKHGDDVHLVDLAAGRDYTKLMYELAATRLEEFRRERIHGFIFKARSPSCGIGDASLTNEQGYESGMRTGVFADRIRSAWPALAVISEAMLVVPDQREAFLARVFAVARFGAFRDGNALARFHHDHRHLLISRMRGGIQPLAAAAGAGDRERYNSLFTSGLVGVPTRRDHTRALEAARLEIDDVAGAPDLDVAQTISAYSEGLIPLATAVAALRGATQRHGVTTLGNDVYLSPHPLCLEAYRWL